jgi:hypothetical protein
MPMTTIQQQRSPEAKDSNERMHLVTDHHPVVELWSIQVVGGRERIGPGAPHWHSGRISSLITANGSIVIALLGESRSGEGMLLSRLVLYRESFMLKLLLWMHHSDL